MTFGGNLCTACELNPFCVAHSQANWESRSIEANKNEQTTNSCRYLSCFFSWHSTIQLHLIFCRLGQVKAHFFFIKSMLSLLRKWNCSIQRTFLFVAFSIVCFVFVIYFVLTFLFIFVYTWRQFFGNCVIRNSWLRLFCVYISSVDFTMIDITYIDTYQRHFGYWNHLTFNVALYFE